MTISILTHRLTINAISCF